MTNQEVLDYIDDCFYGKPLDYEKCSEAFEILEDNFRRLEKSEKLLDLAYELIIKLNSNRKLVYPNFNYKVNVENYLLGNMRKELENDR